MILNKSSQKISLKKHTRLYRFGLVALLLFISFMAFAPLSDYEIIDTGYDKTNHVIAFFVLAFFCHFSFPKKELLYTTFLPLLTYAFFIEIVQYFLPYRTFSLLDVVADVFAVIAYLILSNFLIKH